MIRLVLILSLLSLGWAGCSNRDEEFRAQLEREVTATLHIGDAGQNIESAVREKKWHFVFDGLNRAFIAEVAPKKRTWDDHSVRIWLYVDDSQKITRIKVESLYRTL